MKLRLQAGNPNDANRDYVPMGIKGTDMTVNENGNNSQVYPERLQECTGVLADSLIDHWYEYVPASYDGSKKVPLVVSNHGGRVLDGMAGTADVLPVIAAAVKGKITVLVDGGIRSGEDVLKMLALGADAVLIGRPVAVAAVGGGAAGVALYLEKIRRELSDAMMITGVADVRHVSADILMKLK